MRKSFILAAFFVSIFFLSPEAFSSSQVKEQARLYRKEGYKVQLRGDLQTALSFYLKASQLDPSYKEVYNDLGVVYETLGDLEKAEEMYLKALEIDPNYPAAYTNLGFLYEKKNQPQKAIFYWKKRYLLAKEGDYWRQKARQHLLKLGVAPELERRQEQRIRLQEAKLHFKLGLKALSEGLFKKAEREFKTVIELQPQDERLLEDANRCYKIAQSWIE